MNTERVGFRDYPTWGDKAMILRHHGQKGIYE